MRLLLDENLPPKLASLLPDHEVGHVIAMGWAGLTNGRLLSAAEQAGFELILTADKNMVHQQTLDGRCLGIVVLPGHRLADLRPLQPDIENAVRNCAAGRFWIVPPAAQGSDR